MTSKEKNPPPCTPTAERRSRIIAHTRVVSPVVTPELALRMVTPSCPLWSASLEAAAAAGLPEPFWAFCWPGGQALARHILDHPNLVRGRRVLDFGAGSGLCAIAAMRAGASACTAADIDPTAQVAIALNAEINGVHLDVTGEDLAGTIGAWDVVLVGDMFYDADISRQVLPWLEDLARNGATVLIGDPDRGFLDQDLIHRVASYRVCAEIDPDGSLRVDAGVYVLPRR